MTPTASLLWSWLNVLSTKRYKALIERYKDLDTAMQHIDEEMLLQLGCRNDTVIKTMNRLEDFDPDFYATELQKRNVQILSCEDDHYPKSLQAIPDAPVFLHYRGNLSVVEQPCMAIVGTRTMTEYGRRVAEEWVPHIVQAGVVTVSGLADGIDSVVAEESVRSESATIAVLGYGMGNLSGKKKRLVDSIVETGGLVVSEYALDIPADTYTFPARNRIIAGLSTATLVIEAGEKSGALITANLALDYNRDVFAVPGPVYAEMSVGCNTVIAKGEARLVMSVQDALQQMGIVASIGARKEYESENPDETLLWSLLTSLPQSVSVLQEKSSLPVGTINAALTMMELQGAAKNTGNGQWVKV